MNAVDALHVALSPRSIAIVGASENKNKVGGRPVDYLGRFGFRGAVYPVNPTRDTVQGYRCYPSLASLPESPDLAVIALPGEQVLSAVQGCAARSVRTAIVLSSGFGETGEGGRRRQEYLVAQASEKGMRIVGPNSQGLANFACGAVANFSTMFTLVEPKDGPVAIVSQSGATSAALYGLLRERGVGVRYVLATGNDADVTSSELALTALDDPDIKVLLLYLEGVRDPGVLAKAAGKARQRGVPIIAIKAGRSASGVAAAQSHTGALVSHDGVFDTFFRRHGICRAVDPLEAVPLVQLHLTGVPLRGRRLVVLSNSGSSCVMSADAADELAMPLAQLADATKEQVSSALASFASCGNPIDLTSALLGNGEVFGRVLTALAAEKDVDVVLVSLPVAGAGYDLQRIADDAAAFQATTGKPVVIVGTVSAVVVPFQKRGLITFLSEREALKALDRLATHMELLAKGTSRGIHMSAVRAVELPPGSAPFLSETESLECLARRGVPVAHFRVCHSVQQAQAAARELGGRVVVKACSSELPHKSEHGLVHLDLGSLEQVASAYERCLEGMKSLRVESSAVIVARMELGLHEFVVGAKFDPVFGPIVMAGDGGRNVELLPDICLLLPPFDHAEALAALRRLRVAPLFDGARGEPPMDVDALAQIAVDVGLLMRDSSGAIASIDLNPVIVRARGEGAIVVDALVERTVARQRVPL